MITLRQLHAWLEGSQLFGNPDAVIKRVHTDTRSIQTGDLFVALSGEQFDGNAFIEDAIAKGAIAVIAQHGLKNTSVQGLEVVDAKLALGTIAACWRAQFDLPLIAVTGSNGKTTVTQMLASILRAHAGEQSLATVGNLNNDIGVPLTLMRLRKNHNIAVVELGMNHPGEIAYLSNIAKPTVVLVNNAQREHLEFMVSVEAVAHENGSAISALPDSGVAVYPIDDDYSAVWKALAKQRKTMTFSLDSDADVRCITADWVKGLWQVAADTPMGEISYSLTIAGRHNVKNSLAAVACALSANVPLHTIVAGLQDFSAVKGRSFTQTIHINGRDVLLIDDTYNSNPDSMKVAIDSLSEMAEPKLIVMGDMGEVGEQGLAFHAEAGEYAQKKGIQQLFALGTLSQEVVKHFKGAQHFETMDALLAAVSAVVGTTNSILVKGSRFMKMERVSSHIVALATNDKHIFNNKISINNENNNNKEASHVA
jgi:UDP-N-acetylmuramoyl-tripeptide--D-alanyl-D-alanine ligase